MAAAVTGAMNGSSRLAFAKNRSVLRIFSMLLYYSRAWCMSIDVLEDYRDKSVIQGGFTGH
jgi:hypothetical protein